MASDPSASSASQNGLDSEKLLSQCREHIREQLPSEFTSFLHLARSFFRQNSTAVLHGFGATEPEKSDLIRRFVRECSLKPEYAALSSKLAPALQTVLRENASSSLRPGQTEESRLQEIAASTASHILKSQPSAAHSTGVKLLNEPLPLPLRRELWAAYLATLKPSAGFDISEFNKKLTSSPKTPDFEEAYKSVQLCFQEVMGRETLASMSVLVVHKTAIVATTHLWEAGIRDAARLTRFMVPFLWTYGFPKLANSNDNNGPAAPAAGASIASGSQQQLPAAASSSSSSSSATAGPMPAQPVPSLQLASGVPSEQASGPVDRSLDDMAKFFYFVLRKVDVLLNAASVTGLWKNIAETVHSLDPNLYDHIARLGHPHVGTVLTGHLDATTVFSTLLELPLRCMFVGVLDKESVLYMWDQLFLTDFTLLHKLAALFLVSLRKQLLASATMDDAVCVTTMDTSGAINATALRTFFARCFMKELREQYGIDEWRRVHTLPAVKKPKPLPLELVLGNLPTPRSQSRRSARLRAVAAIPSPIKSPTPSAPTPGPDGSVVPLEEPPFEPTRPPLAAYVNLIILYARIVRGLVENYEAVKFLRICVEGNGRRFPLKLPIDELRTSVEETIDHIYLLPTNRARIALSYTDANMKKQLDRIVRFRMPHLISLEGSKDVFESTVAVPATVILPAANANAAASAPSQPSDASFASAMDAANALHPHPAVPLPSAKRLHLPIRFQRPYQDQSVESMVAERFKLLEIELDPLQLQRIQREARSFFFGEPQEPVSPSPEIVPSASVLSPEPMHASPPPSARNPAAAAPAVPPSSPPIEEVARALELNDAAADAPDSQLEGSGDQASNSQEIVADLPVSDEQSHAVAEPPQPREPSANSVLDLVSSLLRAAFKAEELFFEGDAEEKAIIAASTKQQLERRQADIRTARTKVLGSRDYDSLSAKEKPIADRRIAREIEAIEAARKR